ncbi:hypothetical protein PhCBS80983_g00972 [Powellomyces hirtus]|uniref:Histidine kinase n=1 Tax=Powellomyces hirtus TaxID=109895 RepID=A0A507EES4_9FUNG|nr:hypothetical protein PhCBS80983_g00972 [Powellomyces hirtus]
MATPSYHTALETSRTTAAPAPPSRHTSDGLSAMISRLRDTSAIVCGSNGNACWWSAKASRLFGFDGEYSVRNLKASAGRPNLGDRQVAWAEIAQLAAQPAPQCVQRQRQDGKYIHVLQKVTEIRSSHPDTSILLGYLVSLVDITAAVTQVDTTTDAVNFIPPQSSSQRTLLVSNDDETSDIQIGKILSPASTLHVSHTGNTNVIQVPPVPFPLDAITSLVPGPTPDARESADTVLKKIYAATYGIVGNAFLKEIVRLSCLELDARMSFIGFYVADPHITSATVDLISVLSPPQGFASLATGLRQNDRDRIAAENTKEDFSAFQFNAFSKGDGFLALDSRQTVPPNLMELLKRQQASVIDATQPAMLSNLFEFAKPGELCCVMGLHGDDTKVIGCLGLVFPAEKLTDSVHQLQIVLQRVAPRVTIEIARMTEIDRLKRDKRASDLATKSKSHFLANMSHEIRTPVSAIIGLTDMILWDNLHLSAENRSRLELINSSGEHLLAVINGVLDLSKIGDEDVRFQLKESALRLRKCIKQAVHLAALSPAAAKKKIKIVDGRTTNIKALLNNPNSEDNALIFAWNVEEAVPDDIVGDVTRIRQVVLNLLTNALKFTDKGHVSFNISRIEKDDTTLAPTTFEGQHHPLSHGSESLTGGVCLPTPPDSRRSSDTLSLSDSSETEEEVPAKAVLLFTIVDSGCGIPTEKIKSLFNPYCQIDNPNNRDSAVGTGLGLAISSRLVEMMGGQIWVESSASQGSKFSVCIPFPIADRSAEDSSGDDGRASPSNEGELETPGGRAPSQPDAPDPATEPLFKPAAEVATLLEPVLSNLVKSASNQIKEGAGSQPDLLSPLNKPNATIAVSASNGGSRPSASPSSEKRSQRGFGVNQAKIISAQYPLKILVAEDNPINQQIALSLLRKMGYNADLAEDGVRVLELAERTRYDLILMDLSMPRMGGIEATKELGKRWAALKRRGGVDLDDVNGSGTESGHPPIVIALTASGTAEDFERCKEAGMHDWLNKPFRCLELQAKISQHFAHLQQGVWSHTSTPQATHSDGSTATTSSAPSP